MIEAIGLQGTLISKKLTEEQPNVIDIINDKTVNSIVNTIIGSRFSLRDGFHIHRTATERRIPCFTSLDTTQTALEILLNGGHIYSAQPLPDHCRKEAA